MTIDILVPDLPESVTDATIATWHKKPGDQVARDEVLVEVETDKVVLEIPAPQAGVLEQIIEESGAIVQSKQLIAKLVSAVAAEKNGDDVIAAAEPSVTENEETPSLTPSARRELAQHELSASAIKGSGVGGRITREDVRAHLEAKRNKREEAAAQEIEAPVDTAEPAKSASEHTVTALDSNVAGAAKERRVPMTRLRKRVAERLLDAKNNTAMLTTFNEVNMQAILDLRKRYSDEFEKQHGVRLGMMSFYIKAVVEALKLFPEINAAIDGDDIVYHNYFDISIAVATPRGLVTPVLRGCDKLTLAEIEKEIRRLAQKGRDGKLTVDELIGGTFTITNGGVFGSLLSTPIINPPQSAILGMHKIQDRPMAVNGEVKILPMMYVALSYDHRIVDGQNSVSFLVTVKERLEDPMRLLLQV
ncbi:MAG: 2-oxoglutarate dehydrogenase complex dihydrolipoyllysine-residue succinyltransferase [Vibrionaceae bacterium]